MRNIPFQYQQIISYTDMCSAEGQSLQRGMNFRNDDSVFLMSTRPGAPYEDYFDRTTNTLTYEGHDRAKSAGINNPKLLDQPLKLPSGKLTPNGKFFEAAQDFEKGIRKQPLQVRVYDKIKDGIWAYNGVFTLRKAWIQRSKKRKVIKFSLHLEDEPQMAEPSVREELIHSRMIPSDVKLAVFKRDKGQCVLCGSKNNLHFDHDLAFIHGGTSLLPENIRLLCARHNLQKGAKII